MRTNNATNILRAEAETETELEMLVNGVKAQSGTSVKWKEGQNEVLIIVKSDLMEKTYTVKVMKEL